MRRLALIMIGLGLLLAPAANAAGGDDPGLIAGLRQKPVFVDKEAPGVTADTAGEIVALLKSGDGIVVLMFRDGDTDPASIAASVNQKLGGNRIVGVTIGEKVAGYSTILPAGVAADLMTRAATVSVSPAETLRTFILNVHDWQTQHPKAPAAKPMKKDESNQVVLFLLAGSIIIAVVAVLLFLAWAFLVGDSKETVKLKKSPDRVRDQLHKMLELRMKINDRGLQGTLTQIANDVEAYFRRTKDAARLDQDAFAKHLSSLNSVLEKYVDVQDNPRYFENPDELLQSGSEAAVSFAYFVLETVRREGRRSITDFRVDTDILSAQRYR